MIVVATHSDLIDDPNIIQSLSEKNQSIIPHSQVPPFHISFSNEKGVKLAKRIGAYAFVPISSKTNEGLSTGFLPFFEPFLIIFSQIAYFKHP